MDDKTIEKKITQSFVTLYVNKLQAFTQNDIIAKIPPKILQAIKEKDEHPFFQMYSVCHEGISTPTILGEGAKPITWTRKAVQSIKNIVTKGIKFFKGHNADNSHEGRRILGETIHSFEQEIDGKLHHVAIGYFPPETREEAKKYDICSQEATWNFFEQAGNLVADIAESITGIALENSAKEKPAFKDAKRLGFVQAFDNNAETQNKGDKMDLTTIPFNELQSELKRRSLVPSQVFTQEEILKDRNFPIVSEVENLRKEKDTFIKSEETYKNQIKELNRKTQLNSAKTRLNDIYKELEVTDNIKKYIDESFETRKESLNDITDEGLKSFVENEKNTFQRVAATLNPDMNINIPTGDDIMPSGNDPNKANDNEFLDEDFDPTNL